MGPHGGSCSCSPPPATLFGHLIKVNLHFLSVPEVAKCDWEAEFWMDSRFGSRPWVLPGCGKINYENMSSNAQGEFS